MDNPNNNQTQNTSNTVNTNPADLQSTIPDFQQLETINNFNATMHNEPKVGQNSSPLTVPSQAQQPQNIAQPVTNQPTQSIAATQPVPQNTQTINQQSINANTATTPAPPVSPIKQAAENPSRLRNSLNSVPSYIPFIKTPDIPLTSTTQDHLPIADIVDDIVIYKDGGAAVVLETSSLNFGLLSEKEQVAVVSAYAALINSLSFAIQINVRTQRKDISGYLNFFDTESKKITNPKLTAITQNYKAFITESIKKKTVLGKRFFIAIPFSPLELGVTKSAQSVLKRGKLPFPKDYVVKKAKITLYPKRDHIIRQAGRLGLKLKQLTSKDLIELYWTINNPEAPAVKKDIKI